jgi:hypothetical protein
MSSVNPNYLFFGTVAIILALIGTDLALVLNGNVTGSVGIGFLAGFVTLATTLIAHALGVSSGASAAATGAAAAINPQGHA